MKGKEMKAIVSIGGALDPSLNKSIQSAISSTKGMSVAMSREFGQAGRDLQKLDAVFNGIGRVAKAALSVTAVGAGAVAVGLGAAVKVGSSFEEQMSGVEAISGASASEMEALSDAALELGSTTQFTASEVAESLQFMGMAGWKASEMLSGIDGVINLAAASGEDLATVSDILTDDLTAFGMSASEASRMADVMAATATNANTNVAMMGETFKYAAPLANTLGFSLEEVAVATGLMANSGIKAEQAGTSLRSWMSRMAAPTKQTKEAMDELGLSLTDEEGQMKSFTQIVGETRSAMQGLSSDEQARYASMIAGKNAMSGMLAVINATEEDTRKLTVAIENSTGAAEKMADVRLDNLQGDVTRFKSALEGLGVAVYEEVKEPARDAMKSLTGVVDSLRDTLPKAIADIVKGFPAWKRNAEKFLKPIFTGVKDGVKWIIDHKKEVLGVIAGIGTSLVTYKIGRKIADITMSLKGLKASLGPVGVAIAAVETAIGVATAALTIYSQYENELINSNLDEHLGNVTLSMQEIEKVAEHMVGSNLLTAAQKTVEVFQEADQLFDDLLTEMKTTEELDWKVGIGIDLSEEEKDKYKTSIDTFVDKANEYVEKSHYGVDIALNLAFPENGGDSVFNAHVRNAVNETYTTLEDALTAEGKYLQEIVNNAFSDGILSIDETKAIQTIQTDMAKMSSMIAKSEQQAAFHQLSLKYGVNLDRESSENLKEELAEQAKNAASTFDEAYSDLLTGIYAAAEAGNLSDDLFQRALGIADKGKLDNEAKAYADTLNYFTDTALDAYDLSDKFDVIKESMMKELFAIDADSFDPDRDTVNWEAIFEKIRGTLGYDFYAPDDTTRQAILRYVGLGAPSEEEIEHIIDEYAEKGQKVPEEVADKILNYAVLEGMNGGSYALPDSLVKLIISGMIESTEEQVDAVEEVGKILDQNVAEGIENNQGFIDSASLKAAMQAKQKLGEEFQMPMDLTANVVLDVHVLGVKAGEVVNALDGIRTGGEYRARGSGGVYAYGNGGFTRGVSLAGEDGQEAVISFKSAVRARNIQIWQRAGEILGVTQTAATAPDGGSVSTKSAVTINYTPNITISGSASRSDLESILRAHITEIMDLLEEQGVVPQRGYAYGI